MIVGIVKETAQGERRVAIAPETVGRLERFGVEVVVEKGAGVAAALLDDAYVEAGAKVLDAADVDREAELIVRVQKPTPVEIERLRSQQGLIGFLQPLIDPGPTRAIAERGVTAFSMDAIPRISRAQSMDALSSQATVSGYKSVLLAADHSTKFFPMLRVAEGVRCGATLGRRVNGTERFRPVGVVQRDGLRPRPQGDVVAFLIRGNGVDGEGTVATVR